MAQKIPVIDSFDVVLDEVPVRFLLAEGPDRKLVCFRIEIGPTEQPTRLVGNDEVAINWPTPLKPITTQTLRKIPVASLIQSYLLALAKRIRDTPLAANPDSSIGQLEQEYRRRAERSAPSSRRPGRPPRYGSEHWQEVADVYRRHGGRAARKAVAEHFDVPLSTASNWIATARAKKLLPKVSGV